MEIYTFFTTGIVVEYCVNLICTCIFLLPISITGLSKVGDDSEKHRAYDSGLVRSDLSKDNYHRLLCKEFIMLGYGKYIQYGVIKHVTLWAVRFFLKNWHFYNQSVTCYIKILFTLYICAVLSLVSNIEYLSVLQRLEL